MNFQHVLLSLLALFFAYGCSNQQANVQLEISHNFAFGGPQTAAISKGGLIVWGSNTLGGAFGRVVEDSDTINMKLAPGTWTFYVMSWDGTKDYNGSPLSPGMTYNFGGVVRCGRSAPTLLQSDSATVNLSLSNAGCADPAFKGSASTTTVSGNVVLAPFQPSFCRSALGVTDNLKVCTDSNKEVRKVSGKAPIGSYRVVMKNFDGPPGARVIEPGGLIGKCVPVIGDADGGTDSSFRYGLSLNKVPNLPAGGDGLPFMMEIEMFPGNNDCDATTRRRGAFVKLLPHGVSTQTLDNRYFVDSTNTIHRQFLTVAPHHICAGRESTGLETHPFAGGMGTLEHPYIICSVPQWHAINSSFLNANFKLQADLDFNPFSKGLTAATLPLDACLELGTNFIPVGAVASCTGDILNWSAPLPFEGTLEGSDHKIKGLRFRAEDDNNVGLFAQIFGTGIFIKNLKFENAELSGKSKVGLLSGEIMGVGVRTDVVIENVSVTNLDIRARENTGISEAGGLAGYIDDSTIKNVSILRSRLETDGSQSGGVFGLAINVDMKNIAVDMVIENHNNGTAREYIGGVVGKIMDSNLQFAKFEGAIYAGATKVGGIAGYTGAVTNVTNIYSVAHVRSNLGNSGLALGGLVGGWNSTGTFGPGYSLSYVSSGCMSSCGQGPIVGTVGTTPGSSVNLYKLSALESGENSPGSVSGINTLTLLQFRSAGTTIGSNFGTSSPTDDWHFTADVYPRFDFEKHACAAGATGDGSLLSPKLVCNEAQYLNMEADTGAYFKLGANIRLPSGTFANDIGIFSKVLDGDDFALIGGRHSTTSGSSVGHILQNDGTIKNLNVHGMKRDASNATTATAPGAVFVARNNGTLRKMKTWLDGTFNSYSSLLVGENNGTIRDVTVRGILKGGTQMAPVAYKNSSTGQIIGTNSAPQEFRSNVAAGSNFAGFVYSNAGKILQSEVNLRLEDSFSVVADYVSMVTDTNLATGLIQDFYVSDETSVRIHGTNAYYFHRLNYGTLERVANFGEIVRQPNSYADRTTLTNFAPTSSPGSGIHSFVLRRGGRSGIKLLDRRAFTCNSSIELDIPDWVSGQVLDYANWNGGLGLGAYDSLPFSSKKLMVEAELLSGAKFNHQIFAFDETNKRFTIPANLCTESGGKVSLYWTEDLPFNATPAPVAGVHPHQLPYTAAFLGTIWYGKSWDQTTAEGTANMLSYYAYILGVSTTPAAPAAWEISDDEGLRLFEDH